MPSDRAIADLSALILIPRAIPARNINPHLGEVDAFPGQPNRNHRVNRWMKSEETMMTRHYWNLILRLQMRRVMRVLQRRFHSGLYFMP